jgi:hypothetical protein
MPLQKYMQSCNEGSGKNSRPQENIFFLNARIGDGTKKLKWGRKLPILQNPYYKF